MTPTTLPVDFDPFAEGELERTAPSTEAQQELWTAIQFGGAPASCAFNQSASLVIRGPLDVGALGRALGRVVERHEALRTTLSPDGTTMVVGRSGFPELSVEDVSASPSDAVERARHEAVTTPLDLVHGPLVIARLLRTGDDVHELVVTAHHLVCDGWSTRVIMPELAAIYGEEIGQGPADLPDPESFCRYATVAREVAESPKGMEDRDYWVRLHQGATEALDLPTDYPRPKERTFEARTAQLRLDAGRVGGLRDVGARASASLVATFLSVFEVFLHRITGQVSFAVGMPMAGQGLTGEPCLVGHCVHTLPLRAQIDPNRSFTEHLETVRAHLLEAAEHPHFTFGTLLRALALGRDPSRVPLIPVLFNLDPGFGQLSFPGDLEIEYVSNPRRFESFELYFDAAIEKDVISIEATYNAALFSEAGMRRRLEEFACLLDAIVEDPGRSISEYRIVPESERALLVEWGRRTGPEPPAPGLASLFEQQVERSPGAIAAQDALRSVTYAELDARTNQVARRLGALGVSEGDRVGVLVERGVTLLEALLGTLKAGATYVPLDPNHPETRLRLTAERARLAALVTERRVVQDSRLTEGSVLFMDGDAPDIDSESTDRPDRAEDPNRLAYVTFTSGSTGEPKGVAISDGAVVNFLGSMSRDPGMSAGDRLVAVTTVAFDISVLELFLPLIVGARVFIGDSELGMDGKRLLETLGRTQATILQATPSTYRLLLDGAERFPSPFKALVGGEALPPDLAQALIERGASVFNMYGPTETTVWSTCHEVRAVAGPVPIGRPIEHTECWVLDESKAVLPIGVTGELYIGGRGVARGYFDDDALTGRHFVDSPFDTGQRLYRTGDRVRWTGTGVLAFEGRRGGFIKLRGYRIEPGEVEAALVSQGQVREAVVMLREDVGVEPALCAYVVLSEEVPAEQLRRGVMERLPAYMVPQYVAVLEAIPKTANGKVDRRGLPVPERGARQDDAVLPRTETERALATIWEELLCIDDVGVYADFFMLGGHSMLATRMIGRVREVTGVEVNLRSVFRLPTIAALAEHIDAIRLMGETDGGEDREELIL